MNRIIIGQRGPDCGMWISKPGKDATSSDDSDMMVSPSRFLLQPFLQGRIYSDGSTRTTTSVTHNLGYIPVIELFGPSPAPVAKVTTAMLDFSRESLQNVKYGQGDNSYYYSGVQGAPGGVFYYAIDVTYFIFRAQVAPS